MSQNKIYIEDVLTRISDKRAKSILRKMISLYKYQVYRKTISYLFYVLCDDELNEEEIKIKLDDFFGDYLK